MKAVAENLLIFFDSKGLKGKDVAEMMGVTPSYISALLNNKKEIGKVQAKKMMNLFGLSESWLLTGEGPMLSTGDITQSGGGNTTTYNNYGGCGEEVAKTTQDASDLSGRVAELEEQRPRVSYTSGRPYYDVDFIGGFDLVLNDQSVRPEYNIDFAPYNKDGVMWCNITGRSMEPQISHGDIIAIKEVRDWQAYLNYGEVYALVTANDMRTVKVVRKGSTEDAFRLIPNNTEEYDEQEIPKRMVVRVFEVIGCMKRI